MSPYKQNIALYHLWGWGQPWCGFLWIILTKTWYLLVCVKTGPVVGMLGKAAVSVGACKSWGLDGTDLVVASTSTFVG